MSIKINTEKCLLFVLCYLIGGEIIQKAFQMLIRSAVNVPYHLDTLAIYGVIAGCIVAALFAPGRIPLIDICAWSVLGMMLLAGYAFSPHYSEMYMSIIAKLVIAFVGFFMFRKLSNYELLYDWMKKMALLMTVSMAICLALASGLTSGDAEYSMYYGYLIFPAAAISANEAINTKSILHMANFAFAMLLTLAMGARGPMVCELAFVFLVLIFHQTSPLKKAIELISVSAIVFIIYRHFYELLALMNIWFVKFGLSTRSIVKIQRGIFFESKGRSSIREIAINIINDHPLTGVGLGRDRVLISQGLFLTPDKAVGCYPHNFFLEIIMQFGFVFGIVIIAAVMFLIIAPQIIKKMDSAAFSLYMICLAVGFFPLMVSGSYLSAPAFFYMLGLDLSIINNERLKTRVAIQISPRIDERVQTIE